MTGRSPTSLMPLPVLTLFWKWAGVVCGISVLCVAFAPADLSPTGFLLWRKASSTALGLSDRIHPAPTKVNSSESSVHNQLFEKENFQLPSILETQKYNKRKITRHPLVFMNQLNFEGHSRKFPFSISSPTPALPAESLQLDVVFAEIW